MKSFIFQDIYVQIFLTKKINQCLTRFDYVLPAPRALAATRPAAGRSLIQTQQTLKRDETSVLRWHY